MLSKQCEILSILSIHDGSTSNLCAIDLSKAFDKVNHRALFLKLMKRLIPNQLLDLLVSWISGCYSYVKWHHAWSQLFNVDFGVRQGSVLSSYLFAVYMDDSKTVCVDCIIRGRHFVVSAIC